MVWDKDGRYYWVFTEFETRTDTATGAIVGYEAHRKVVSKHIIDIIEKLYKELLYIESTEDVEASEKYLNTFMHAKGQDINFANIMEEIHRFY